MHGWSRTDAVQALQVLAQDLALSVLGQRATIAASTYEFQPGTRNGLDRAWPAKLRRCPRRSMALAPRPKPVTHASRLVAQCAVGGIRAWGENPGRGASCCSTLAP